ncbi:MAG: PH domain-containing protein [Anaerolineaceae bacterium]|nr:PH domain-containing protein [Anaerolineaceae bacterium]
MVENRLDFQTIFEPDRRKGLLTYGGGILFLLVVMIVSLIFLLRSVGVPFVIFLLLFLGALAGIPLLGYRLFGLLKSRYIISRDGLYMRWGMREFQLPIQCIEWARTVESVAIEIPLPRFHWSGVLVGDRVSRELGMIEFLSTGLTDLLLIATDERVYAISPRDTGEFTRALRLAMESGSLTPMESVVKFPVSIITELWENRVVKILLAAGFSFNVGLLVLVSLVIPQQTDISIGFDPVLNPLPKIPVSSLRLLSFLSILFAMVDFGLGFYFYQKEKLRPISLLLWGMSGFLPFLLIIAIGFF